VHRGVLRVDVVERDLDQLEQRTRRRVRRQEVVVRDDADVVGRPAEVAPGSRPRSMRSWSRQL
jgi:hypothetical protein